MIKLLTTRAALNEEDMTGIIGAVDMVITRGSTLVAVGDHILADSFAQPFIKHKVFANKQIGQTQVFHIMRIFDDASV